MEVPLDPDIKGSCIVGSPDVVTPDITSGPGK